MPGGKAQAQDSSRDKLEKDRWRAHLTINGTVNGKCCFSPRPECSPFLTRVYIAATHTRTTTAQHHLIDTLSSSRLTTPLMRFNCDSWPISAATRPPKQQLGFNRQSAGSEPGNIRLNVRWQSQQQAPTRNKSKPTSYHYPFSHVQHESTNSSKVFRLNK